MSNIEYVSNSHETFPDDPYTKELVYLLLDGKYRVCYVRKQAKNMGLFWSGITLAVSKGGAKAYYPAFEQDSRFLEKDIKTFLEERSWEKKITPKAFDESVPF